jgi:hypothetical protein
VYILGMSWLWKRKEPSSMTVKPLFWGSTIGWQAESQKCPAEFLFAR